MLGLLLGLAPRLVPRLPQSILRRSMSSPPQPPPNWNHEPNKVLDAVKSAIAEAHSLHNSLAALPPPNCNFDSLFLPLAQSEARLESTTEPLVFYQNVSPSKLLRDAANDAEQLLRDFNVDASMRLDLFNAQQHAKSNIDAANKPLSPEDARLVEKMLLDGKRAGLMLSEDQRKILSEKKKQLSQVCLEFAKNNNEEKSTIAFSSAELDGVPSDVVAGFVKHPDSDLYDVTYKTPDILPIYRYAKNPETRRRTLVGSEGRLAINAPLLDQAISLRKELASLLGYPTWADYVTEEKMVKNAHMVYKFLDDLEGRLKPVGQNDLKTLLELKKEECEKRSLPFDNNFYLWDYRYYDRLFTELSLSLDDSLVKEFFPVKTVVPAILEIYQDLLGVTFKEINGTVWHPDVQQFSVWNTGTTEASGFLGYCYLDLYPREAKYSHAAVWSLIPGCDLPSGERQYPVTAMVANLAKPTSERPALMTHDDVVTFFHEMGHAFHGLLSRTKHGRFHGTNVARDFVEAPSQMLENWCWEPKILHKISSHYKTKEPLSSGLIEKIIKSRYVNVGLYFLRQVFFAKFDMKVHTESARLDTTKLWNDMREEISLVKSPTKPEPGQGSFGHLTGGYDAGYYGYTYSLVFAADMYDTVFRKDPLDQSSGSLYREKILKPGASRDEMSSLRDFLGGREPTMDAFLRELFSSTQPVERQSL